MNNSDYYRILDLQPDADDNEIKRAYRRLALKYHPDQNPGDARAEEKFKEVSRAYSVLNDPSSRRLYDRMGHRSFTEHSGNSGPSYNPGTPPFAGRKNPGCGRGMGRGMGCGRGGFRNRDAFAFARPEKSLSGDELIFKLNITREESANGTQKTFHAMTEEGIVRIKVSIKPGTANGTKIKLFTNEQHTCLDKFYVLIQIKD